MNAWDGLVAQSAWHPVIRCEFCSFRHRLERAVLQPEVVYIICHGCERPLQATVTAADMLKTYA